MSIFGSSEKGAGEKPPQSKATPVVASLSIVGAGMTVRGDLDTEGVVKVEGTVDGHVRAGQQVLVAKGGVVHGDIETNEAVVGGAVDGSIVAKDRIEVQSGASVAGDVTTRRIAVAEGATLNGQIRMGEGTPVHDDKSAARSQPAPVPSRPSTAPVARIAMPPRVTNPGPGQ